VELKGRRKEKEEYQRTQKYPRLTIEGNERRAFLIPAADYVLLRSGLIQDGQPIVGNATFSRFGLLSFFDLLPVTCHSERFALFAFLLELDTHRMA